MSEERDSASPPFFHRRAVRSYSDIVSGGGKLETLITNREALPAERTAKWTIFAHIL
jgi:hypothetical protein